MKISVGIPSINRPQLLKLCLQAIYANTDRFDIELFLVTEDKETRDQAQFWFKHEFIRKNFNTELIYSENRIGALECWNYPLHFVDQKNLYFPVGDDGILTEGALEKVVKEHERIGGYGVVGFNDGYIPNELVVTHFILDCAFMKNELGGVMLCPLYKAYRADNELNERAKRVGKLSWDDTAFLLHEHSSRNKRPIDDIDKEKIQWWTEDENLFYERKTLNFPNNFNAILK